MGDSVRTYELGTVQSNSELCVVLTVALQCYLLQLQGEVMHICTVLPGEVQLTHGSAQHEEI